MQANGGQLDPRVLASLDRVRDVPPQGRYVMVDTGGARLYMIDDGNIVEFDEGHRRQGGCDDPDADDRQHDLLCDAQSLLARVGRNPSFDDRANVLDRWAWAI